MSLFARKYAASARCQAHFLHFDAQKRPLRLICKDATERLSAPSCNSKGPKAFGPFSKPFFVDFRREMKGKACLVQAEQALEQSWSKQKAEKSGA